MGGWAIFGLTLQGLMLLALILFMIRAAIKSIPEEAMKLYEREKGLQK